MFILITFYRQYRYLFLYLQAVLYGKVLLKQILYEMATICKFRDRIFILKACTTLFYLLKLNSWILIQC